jgi:F-type H+-transporting ATPase subunit delta
MAELTTIARPYAKAAFLFAKEQGVLEQWESMLATAAAVMADPSVSLALDNPALGASRKAAVLAEICGDAIDSAFCNYLDQLAQNKRLSLLATIAGLFHQLLAAESKFADVELVSAFPLEDADAAGLVAALKKRLGVEVRVSKQVDPSLIGGVLVRAGDTVIDGSVRGRLNKLVEQLNSRV